MDIFNSSVIPLLKVTDILVIGAGSAGCIAALAASGSRKYSVFLAERYGFPGGTSTQMLDTFYGFFTPGEAPRKIVSGWPDIIVNELDRTNDIFLRPNTYGAGTGVNYNPERLKMVWDTLIQSANIDYWLHTLLVGVTEEEQELITCIFWSKGGFFKVKAKRIIDASGDADFCHHYGLPYELAGEIEPAQSMTTTFRMCNVDLDKFLKAGGNKMLKAKMNDAVQSGKHLLPRKEGSAHEMCQPRCVSTVAVKVSGPNALAADGLTQAEVEGRAQAFIYERFFSDEIPGYENSRIIGMSHQIGVRETRRVYGEKRLTKDDCMAAEVPGDSVFLCGAPVEDHREAGSGQEETYWQYIPRNGVYGVPYGTIVPQKSSRVWIAGRCFSATHDAHASCRSMAQTMSMGQAAGIAAVLSLEEDAAAYQMDINKLRMRLAEKGVILEFPDRIADTGRNDWKKNL
jgi:hypothetical protein